MIILCDHCEADLTTCSCPYDIPVQFRVDQPDTPILDVHPHCPVCLADLDGDEQACDCDDDRFAPWDFNDDYV